ncbi:MAG: mechanosensitive ion channel [Candidatus Omnitrophica bacterium]|nr:mechanosensitive ion channel [Candidatus Omnitrophota bacterium]
MEESLNKVYLYLITYGFDLLAAILIFFVGKWAAKTGSRFIEQMMIKTHVDATLAKFVKHLSYGTAMVFIIIAALSKVGVQTTSLVAVVGAAGLAVGLALQGSLSNFAAGVILILFKPFKVGDAVEAAGVTGSVDEIQIFNTVINAPDNRKIIVPNAKITGDNITNFTDVPNRRLELKFSISYGDDLRKAKDVLMKLMTADSRILKDPSPMVAVSELADNGVNLICRPWVKPSDYWNVYFDLIEKAKLGLEENGMTIPFPQREVHIYEHKNGT